MQQTNQMKTPLQRHIEWLEIRCNAYSDKTEKGQAYQDALKDAQMLLEYEKTLINFIELYGFAKISKESELGSFWREKIEHHEQ